MVLSIIALILSIMNLSVLGVFLYKYHKNK